MGYGFWEKQTELVGAWYPWANKATAVVMGLTHGISSKKDGFDVTPGQNLTLNWGVSQYLPMAADQTLLAEVGIAGYDTWQVTSDSGQDATSSALDRVHGVGLQLGMSYVPWGAALTFRYLYEYAAVDRFQGAGFGLTIAKAF